MSVELDILRSFWEDEVLAHHTYSLLCKKTKDKRFLELAEMEKKHAEFWNSLAEKYYNTRFRQGLRIKIKKLMNKALATIVPTTFLIHYLEFGERDAVLEYSKILSKFREKPEIYEKIREVVIDEIKHETELARMIIGEEKKLSNIKDAIYGMTDSLVEILALVTGLAGALANPITIGLAGLISAIGGTFSMTSGAYLSAKSQNDLYQGSVKEVEAKKLIAPEILLQELQEEMTKKGVDEETIKKIIEPLKNNPETIETLVKTMKITEKPANPKETAKTTGIYYIIGALPAILPFFIGHIIRTETTKIAIVAIALSATIALIAGILTAILSGTSIKRKAIENVLIILGATAATYTIGKIATTILGIQI